MDMDIPLVQQYSQIGAQALQIGFPGNRLQGRTMKALQARLELKKAFRRFGQQRQRLGIKKIRRHLKMKPHPLRDLPRLPGSDDKAEQLPARPGWQLKVRSTSFIVLVPDLDRANSCSFACSKSKKRTGSSRPERQKAQEKGQPREVSR